MSYLPARLSTGSTTDGSYLFRALGSFWSQMFAEKDTLKGYTLGQAEELIQRYQDLLEVVNSCSVRDIPVFHRERWSPLRILRSEYNSIPLIFRPATSTDKAQFGLQTSASHYYQSVTFQFGRPKVPAAEVYVVKAPKDLRDFPLICNRVLQPSLFLLRDGGISLSEGLLYFNTDIFNRSDVVRYDVLTSSGEPVTFVDAAGQIQQEQEAVLWLYNGDYDADNLFQSLGYVFDFKLPNDLDYKRMLSSVFGLFVNGPTVRHLKTLAAAFAKTDVVRDPVEVVEEVYSYGDLHVVVTDLNAYRFSSYHALLPEVKVGAKFYAGDLLVDAVEYQDHVTGKQWWSTSFTSGAGSVAKYPELAFPPFLFLGGYKSALVFKNSLLTLSRDSVTGTISFPVHGSPADVAEFNRVLNLNQKTIAAKFNLAAGGSQLINPLHFLFDNFFKHNTALLRLNFPTLAAAKELFTIFPILQDNLPPHVYLLFFLEFSLDQDVVSGLNSLAATGAHTLEAGTVVTGPYLRSMDGSDAYGRILGAGSVVSPVARQFYTGRTSSDLITPSTATTTTIGTVTTTHRAGSYLLNSKTTGGPGGLTRPTENSLVLCGLPRSATDEAYQVLVTSGKQPVKLGPGAATIAANASVSPLHATATHTHVGSVKSSFLGSLRKGAILLVNNHRYLVLSVNTDGKSAEVQAMVAPLTVPAGAQTWSFEENLSTKDVSVLNLLSF